MAFYGDKAVASLVIVNPDNPSGNFIPKADLLRLCAWAKARGMSLVIDESFVDFSDEGADNTLLTNAILEENPHLAVVKSISKSYGDSGLRLGVIASADTALISRFKKEVAIWNINSFGEFYMQIFGKYESQYHEACAAFRKERDRFMAALGAIPFLRVMPSKANYFMCEVKPPHTAASLALTLLERYNILIKDLSRKRGIDGNQCIRLAVRDTTGNNALVDALREIAKS